MHGLVKNSGDTMIEQYYFRVNGMKCQGCVDNIESAVNELEGVEHVEADLETSMVIVKGTASSNDITASIDAAGYNAILLAE